MADELIAIVTNTAQAYRAKALAYGYGIQITRFVVGNSGHDPSNPRLPLTPDPSRTGCYCGADSITTTGGCVFTDVIDAITWVNEFCAVYTCRLESTEAIGVVSSICLVAEIVYSPIPSDPLVGTEFLYGIVNLPYRVKVAGEVLSLDIAIPTKL